MPTIATIDRTRATANLSRCMGRALMSAASYDSEMSAMGGKLP